MDPSSSISILVVQKNYGDPFQENPIQGKETFVKNILSVSSTCQEGMPEINGELQGLLGVWLQRCYRGARNSQDRATGTCPQPRKLYSPPKKCENWISGGCG